MHRDATLQHLSENNGRARRYVQARYSEWIQAGIEHGAAAAETFHALEAAEHAGHRHQVAHARYLRHKAFPWFAYTREKLQHAVPVTLAAGVLRARMIEAMNRPGTAIELGRHGGYAYRIRCHESRAGILDLMAWREPYGRRRGGKGVLVRSSVRL